MILQAGRRAFAALSDLLDLPGTRHLNDVDVSVASPVIDLLSMARRAGGVEWVFISDASDDSTIVQDSDPRDSSDWEKIVRDGDTVTETFPANHDLLVTGLGLYVSINAANISTAQFFREISGTINTDPTLRQLIANWNLFPADGGSFDGGAACDQALRLPFLIRPVSPWTYRHRIALAAVEVTQASIILSGVSAPTGTFDQV